MKKLLKKIIKGKVFETIEPAGHKAEAFTHNMRLGWPAKGLNVIGITGTNGKTTTAFLVYYMLKEAGYKVGLMTTVAYGVGDNLQPQVQHMTTLSAPQLLSRIKNLKSQGIDWLVLETTSHALAQNRVYGIPYSVAVMTNVTHEHLDYHKTFERYLAAKLKLFKLAAKNKRGLQVGVVNADDPNAAIFAKAVPYPLLYGIDNKKAHLVAKDITATAQGSRFKVEIDGKNVDIRVNLPGKFNVSNALAAIGVGMALDIEPAKIARGIDTLKTVEGRMNSINEGQNFGVIVDFAHTPDSFEQLLPVMKDLSKGRLIAVFGSAGRRDETKRAVQGEIAGKYADLVIVTEEDDRDVDGQQIMDEIASGAEKTGKVRGEDLLLVHDRTQAIQKAIDMAQSGDVVLLLGKGHEKTIERADGEHAWDETETARAALHKRLNKA